MLEFNLNDGGRSQYYKGAAGDCVTRAIAIAAKKDYKEVYDELHKLLGYSPRDGIKHSHTKKCVEHFGFHWTPLMQIGSGCKYHLRENEVPMTGSVIVSLSGHLAAVVDGVLNDIYDCSRNGTRCVYGYWSKEKSQKPAEYTEQTKVRYVVELLDLAREYDCKTFEAAKAMARRMCNHYTTDRYRITKVETGRKDGKFLCKKTVVADV